jgi:CRP/FNR family transcriptional regulator
MDASIARIVAESEFFRGLSPEACARMAALGRERRLRKGEVLFLEHTRGRAIFLLTEGRVALTKSTADGRDIGLRTVKPGETFAEVVLFEEDRYPATATALTAVRALAFARMDVRQLLETRAFRDEFIAMLMRKQRYLTERVRRITSCDVEERLALFLREQFGQAAAIVPALTKKDVAAAIGAAPETFSRLLRRLRQRKLLVWQGRQLHVAERFWKEREEPA